MSNSTIAGKNRWPARNVAIAASHELFPSPEAALQETIRDRLQRLDGQVGITARGFQRQLQRAVTLQDSPRLLEISMQLLQVGHGALPEFRFTRRVRVGDGLDDRQGHLPFPEIVAQRLAAAGIVCDVIEHVVGDLECDAQVHAVVAHRPAFGGAAVRDDSARFLGEYTARGVFPVDPFISLDIEGVGELVKIAAERGRRRRPALKLGICGEHGGDPASIAFCEEVGLDYVSASPYRVPIARLAAAQAALRS